MATSRGVTTVDYFRFCSEHGMEPCGIHKIDDDGRPCVLISGEMYPYVAMAIEYKFGSTACLHSDGLLLLWDARCIDERDRFYRMCSAMLSGILPEHWTAIRGHL